MHLQVHGVVQGAVHVHHDPHPTKHVGSSKLVHGPFFLRFGLPMKSQKGPKKRWISQAEQSLKFHELVCLREVYTLGWLKVALVSGSKGEQGPLGLPRKESRGTYKLLWESKGTVTTKKKYVGCWKHGLGMQLLTSNVRQSPNYNLSMAL